MAKEESTRAVKMKKAKKTVPIHRAERYLEAVGRRKTAVARVRIASGGEKGSVITVNGRPLAKYFPVKKLQEAVRAPFAALSIDRHDPVSVQVRGGGIKAQAEAIRLGLARALVALDPASRGALKSLGYLKRDPRMVERKKPGLRKARRPQQWRKR